MAKDARIPLFPKPGIYRGATADISATRWWDMNLMRWRGDQLQPVGGWAALEGIDLDSPGRDMLSWHDNAGGRWLVIGTDTKLWAYDFATQTLRDITPAGVGPLEPPGAALGYGLGDYSADLYGTARDSADIGIVDVSPILGDMWSLALYGEDLLILPTQSGTLFRWSPSTPDTVPAVVANAPTANAAVAVTDQRSIVLIGSGGDSRMVAWSDLENTTVWDPLVTNLAGSKALETEGRPLAIIRTPSGLLIFTDNDVHLMQYVGPPYAYGITKIGSNCGPVSRRAITQAGAVTTWMTSQSFWMYDGSLSPLNCDVGDWLFSLINRSMVGRVFAYANSGFNEIWFHWPDEGSNECNRYAAVDFTSAGREWIIGAMDRTAADKRSSMAHPLLSDLDGLVQIHEFGWTANGTTRVGSVYVETGTVALDQSEDTRFTIKQIVQDFTGPADRVGYRFSFWEEPNGNEYDTGTFKVVNDSGRTDIGSGFSCRGLRMRIEAVSDGPFAIGRTRLIARPGGRI